MMSPISTGTLISADKTLLGVMRLEQALIEQTTNRVKILPVIPHFNLPPLAFITHRRFKELPDAARAFHDILHKSARDLQT
jgi:hypothetical protein